MILTEHDVQNLTGRTPDDHTATSVRSAVALVAGVLTSRRFDVVEIVETLEVERVDGELVVHPTVKPVVAVTAPAVRESSAVIGVDGVAQTRGRVEVTYTAGWDADTLPSDLAQLIADVSVHYATLAANRGAEVSPAVDSASVGGVGFTKRAPGVAGIERMSPGATAVLNRFGAR